MGLADDLEAALPPAADERCHACDRVTALEGRDKQWLERALNEKTQHGKYQFGAKKLSQIARRNGLLLPEADVRNHRNEGHAG